MKPNLTYPSGYAQRLPSGDIEINTTNPILSGYTRGLGAIVGAKILLPKDDAKELAKFILEEE